MLSIALPKGSLEQATLELLEDADLPVNRTSNRDYRPSIDDPRIDAVRILRPQEIPHYVAEGLFDLGIAGRDWVEETGADVVTLAELKYSKATQQPVRIVVAVPAESPVDAVAQFENGIRVSTEFPNLTARYFDELGIEADIRLSYGATEAKVPDIVDAIVELTETGSSLRAAGLKIVGEIMTSYTELLANRSSYDDLEKRQAMEQITTLLMGTLEARGRVLVKLNVDEAKLDDVIEILPALKAPTINQLYGENAYAVEAVVPKAQINILIPALKEHGATDLLEIPISKIVH